MDTKIVYYDESGDDGLINSSSPSFILTALYMPTGDWRDSFSQIKKFRKDLRIEFNFPQKLEFHTKDFLYDKNPYRNFAWSTIQKKRIFARFIQCLAQLKNVEIINVLIDKTNITSDSYPILENALTYSIQRLENSCKGQWNYIIITDPGRLAPMRKTARAITVFNPIPSVFTGNLYQNKPIENLIEDILEKDSSESYFIQMCDMISYIVNLYYNYVVKGRELPKRVGGILTKDSIIKIMNYLKEKGIFNLRANGQNEYGIVIYPK